MKENSQTKSELKSVSPLAQNAGAFLVVAILATVGGLLAYGSTMKAANPWVIGCLLVGFGALICWFIGRSQQKSLPRDQFAKQRTLIGTNALISTTLLFVLLVGVNYVAARRHKTFDLTNNKVNTLADQTLKALATLKTPLNLTYVYVPDSQRPTPYEQDKNLLDKYKLASDNIRVKYVNAVFEPAALRELNLVGFTGRPTILVEPESKKQDKKSDDKTASRQQVDSIDEANLTSALLKLGKNQSRVLYYLTGHGELGFDAANARFSYNLARAKLAGQNYTIKPLSLNGKGAKIPVDASVLVVLGPKSDLSAGEENILQKYLGGKGHLLLALTSTESVLSRWNNIARLLGAKVLNGYVNDPEQFAGQSMQMVYGQIGDASKHPVLGGVGENSNVVFPGAVPLKPLAAPPGATATILLESSPSSQSLPTKNGGTSEAGPFALAIASERAGSSPTDSAMRALVVCNANFGSDVTFTPAMSANGDFLLSSINWLAGNELLVSIPPKPPVTNTIDMTPGVRRFANIFSMFTMPIILLFIGGVVWWKRK